MKINTALILFMAFCLPSLAGASQPNEVLYDAKGEPVTKTLKEVKVVESVYDEERQIIQELLSDGSVVHYNGDGERIVVKRN